MPIPGLARPQEAYDRFSAATGLPLAILALLWLPILVVPLVAHLPAGLADTFDVIGYVVWAVFAAEYLVKLYLAPSRRRFFTCHLLDLAVVALPVLRPLRALRLLRLLTRETRPGSSPRRCHRPWIWEWGRFHGIIATCSLCAAPSFTSS